MRWLLASLTGVSLLFSVLLVRVHRVLLAWRRRLLPPRLVLVLGGDLERERKAAQLCAGDTAVLKEVAGCPWKAEPSVWTSLPVLVSSAHGGAKDLFARVEAHRLTVDEEAYDTITNFTTSLEMCKVAEHVLVLTSDYHARRASAVASLVLGSHGVASTVCVLRHESSQPTESRLRCWRDCARALLWSLTGFHAGEAIGRLFHPERFYHLDARRKRS